MDASLDALAGSVEPIYNYSIVCLSVCPLQGGGVLMDEWWSKFRTLSRKLGHEEESLATGLN